MSNFTNKLKTDYNFRSHMIGKVWMLCALIVFFSVPTTICLYYDVKPDMSVLASMAVLVPFVINFLSGIVEPIIYSPMLGVNSAYLAFITGNLSNLKIPCVVKAQEICETKLGTEENEVVATLSVATSTLVTTVIIAVFVLILALSNISEAIDSNPWIMPAFTCVVYALFGSLGGKYIIKNFKLAIFPLIIIVVLSIILGVVGLGEKVGSAYLFIGIAICAVFAALQIVREKKKQALQAEQEHLENIAREDVEIVNFDEQEQSVQAQEEQAQEEQAQDEQIQNEQENTVE